VSELEDVLAAWLPKQRWYGGKGKAVTGVRVEHEERLSAGEDVRHTLLHVTDEDGGTDGQGVRLARPVPIRPVQMEAPPEVQQLLTAAATAAQDRAGKPDYSNVGPDDQCPCGSGKKFKQCHRNRV